MIEELKNPIPSVEPQDSEDFDSIQHNQELIDEQSPVDDDFLDTDERDDTEELFDEDPSTDFIADIASASSPERSPQEESRARSQQISSIADDQSELDELFKETSGEVDPEEERERVKVEKADALSSDERITKIKELAERGLKKQSATDKITGVAGKALKGAGDAIFSWLKKDRIEKTKTIGEVVGIAAEDTVNSLLSFGPDLVNFFVDVGKFSPETLKGIPGFEDGELQPVEIDIVSDSHRTPTKEFIADLGTLMAAWTGVAKATGLFKKWKNIKSSGDFLKVFGQDMLLNGLVDFVLIDTEDNENIVNFLNKYPGWDYLVYDGLAADEDDTALEKRFKNFFIGAQFGGSVELVAAAVRGSMAFVKALRLKSKKSSGVFKASMNAEGVGSSDDLVNKMTGGEKQLSLDETPSAVKPSEGKPTAGQKKPETQVENKAKAKAVEDKLSQATGREQQLLFDLEQDYLKNDPYQTVNFVFKEGDEKRFKNLGVELMGEGRSSPLKSELLEYQGTPFYKSLPQLDADVELFYFSIKEGLGDVGKYGIKEKLYESAKHGLNIQKVDPEIFIAEISRIRDLYKDYSKNLKEIKINNAIDDFLYSVHPIPKQRDVLFEIDNLKERFQSSRSELFRPSEDPEVLLKSPKEIETKQSLAHNISVAQKKQIDDLADLLKRSGITLRALKATNQKERYLKTINQIQELIEEYGLFQAAVYRNKSASGQLLKAMDVATPDQELLKMRLIRSGEEKVNLYDRGAVAKIIGNPDLDMTLKIEKLLDLVESHNLDLKAVLKNGNLEIMKDVKPENMLRSTLDWLGNTLVMNLVSGVSTALDITLGNAGMGAIRITEAFFEDVFSSLGRAGRWARGYNLPQTNESKALNRLVALFTDVPRAFKDSWDYFVNKKPLEKVPFYHASARQDLWRYMTNKQSPLVVASEAIKKRMDTKLDVGVMDKLVRGMATFAQYLLNGAEMVVGYKRLRAMDIVLRNSLIESSIRNEALRIVDAENMRRVAQGKKLLTQKQLREKADIMTRQAIEESRVGVFNNLALKASEDANLASMMSNKAAVIGSKAHNLGGGVRAIQRQVRKIPGLGPIFTAFTHIGLNSANFRTRYIPGLNFLNPEIRDLWRDGYRAELLGKSMVGVTAGLGVLWWQLTDKDPEMFHADTPSKKKAMREIFGFSPYAPVQISSDGKTMHVLNESDPIGMLSSFWVKWNHYKDDWKDHKDFSVFMQDTLSMLLESVVPFDMLNRYKLLTDFFKEKSELGYASASTISNLLHAGILKEINSYVEGKKLNSLVQMSGEADPDYKIQQGRFYQTGIKWKQLWNRNISIFEKEGSDKGVAMTDAFGDEILNRNKSPRKPFNEREMVDYFDIAKRYYNFLRKKLPVSSDKIYKDLYLLSDDSGLTEEANKNPLRLYSDYRINVKEVMSALAWTSMIDKGSEKLFVDMIKMNNLDGFENFTLKNWSMNDVGVRAINMLSAGDKEVRLGDRIATGEEKIKQFMLDQEVIAEPTVHSDFSADNLSLILKNWKDVFYSYGYTKKGAIKKLLYFEGEPAIRSKWDELVRNREVQLGGKEISNSERQLLLREILRNRVIYQPPGYLDGHGPLISKSAILGTYSDHADFLVYKLMLPHLTAEQRENYRSSMRKIINSVVAPYNDFAKFTYLRNLMDNEKAFKQNILDKYLTDMETVAPDVLNRLDETGVITENWEIK